MKLAIPGAISGAVRDEISYDLSVQDALARDYANISALARMLQPRIEEKLGQTVNMESIITSLKRLRGSYTPASEDIRTVIAESVVNVRTHVSKISVEKTRKALEAVSGMLASHHQDFIQVSESLNAITLIFDQKLHKKLRAKLADYVLLEEGDDYAAITVQSPPLIMKTPGCIINFYNEISRAHVNIEDTVSCFTDTIVVVKMKEVAKAFTALTELITEERKRLEERE
ncbi:MAG: ACT domain-containing protein [Thaumarchaeota archaeon]|nr:ACT domain-containing protein [Nitrososphaerota archaeon]